MKSKARGLLLIMGVLTTSVSSATMSAASADAAGDGPYFASCETGRIALSAYGGSTSSPLSPGARKVRLWLFDDDDQRKFVRLANRRSPIAHAFIDDPSFEELFVLNDGRVVGYSRARQRGGFDTIVALQVRDWHTGSRQVGKDYSKALHCP